MIFKFNVESISNANFIRFIDSVFNLLKFLGGIITVSVSL